MGLKIKLGNNRSLVEHSKPCCLEAQIQPLQIWALVEIVNQQTQPSDEDKTWGINTVMAACVFAVLRAFTKSTTKIKTLCYNLNMLL